MRIELQQLSHTYHGNRLFNINKLTWRSGDSIHLCGANGSGKSTLMKIMAGLLKPTHGQVRRLGHVAPTGTTVIYLHQQPYLFDTSVRGNLEYGLRWHKQADKTRVDQVLDWVGLAALQQHDVIGLSGGERQRLAIGRALVLQPQMLLLDEPSSNLDKDSLQRMVTLLRYLQQQGTSLMLACHQADSLAQLCQQRWHLINSGIQVSTYHTNPYEQPDKS